MCSTTVESTQKTGFEETINKIITKRALISGYNLIEDHMLLKKNNLQNFFKLNWFYLV